MLAMLSQTGSALSMEWKTNYKDALATAAKDQRFVYMFFTGSDWCPYCQVLQKQVFDQPEFAKLADEYLVPLMLDFPSRKQQAAALRSQNEFLQSYYKVSGYPTVIILAPDGRYIATEMFIANETAKTYVPRLAKRLALLKLHPGE